MLRRTYTLSFVILLLPLLCVAGCNDATRKEAKRGSEIDHLSPCLTDVAAPVFIQGGTYKKGSAEHYAEERPVKQVSISAFLIDPHEVTNRQFAEFIAATGYVTIAELTPDPADHPDIPLQLLKPGSAVFESPLASKSPNWWRFQGGAYWRAPEGPNSSIEDRMDHPVVHIAYEDALAYAVWKSGDLPTEAQWEFAARSGLDGAPYEWGETHPDEGAPRANTWQGAFPLQNTARDGYIGAAPVRCYPPNAYGLYDMTGNVWEWVKDGGDERVGLVKGGSHLCAENYCRRYRPAAKQFQEKDFSASHIGFRLVYRTDQEVKK